MIATGTIVALTPTGVTAIVPGTAIGSPVVLRGARSIAGSVSAVLGDRVEIVPFGSLDGVRVGDVVDANPRGAFVPLGLALLGRALDGAGDPLDGGPAFSKWYPLLLDAPKPHARVAVSAPLWTGIRSIDAFATIGRGARVGLFGPPGAGKTTAIEMLCNGSNADAAVVALVGERGREAQDWIERCNARTTVVCATSDRTPQERIRAAELAMAQASRLRRVGLNVLLVVDSLARYAAALRERAVAAGESVGRAGYPASVFAALARYVEIAGCTRAGSVTMLATVLVDDPSDPVAQSARSLLDGHVVLSVERAQRGFFPAIDPAASLSRTMSAVADPEHGRNAAAVRAALVRLETSSEARALGLVPSDPATAAAMTIEGELAAWLAQGREWAHPEATLAKLAAFADIVGRR